jgi:hypothetical protein
VLALVQIVLGIVRPSAPAEGAEESSKRKIWRLAHSNIGRFALALAFVQMVLGALVVDYITHDNFAVLVAVLMLIIIYSVAFVYAGVLRVVKGKEKHAQMDSQLANEA